MCARVCASVGGYAQVYTGVHGCAWVREGVHGCARVCAGVCGCVRVCAGVHEIFKKKKSKDSLSVSPASSDRRVA